MFEPYKVFKHQVRSTKFQTSNLKPSTKPEPETRN